MASNFSSFHQAILDMGATDEERAKKLGISIRTITEYKAYKYPRIVRALAKHPVLVQALLQDALRETGNDTTGISFECQGGY